jgi:tetratricopeptide (TPR) repeat protein
MNPATLFFCFFTALTLLLSGCSTISGKPPFPGEPTGKVVSLSEEDRKKERMYHHSYILWDLKGTRLNNEGHYDEALYCFHQAIKEYPAKDPRPENERRIRWTEEPTSAYFSLAVLYIRLRKPDYSIKYIDRMEKFVSLDPTTMYYRMTALYMLKDYEKAYEISQKHAHSGASIMRGAILVQKGEKDRGMEIIKRKWFERKAKNIRTEKSLQRIWWDEIPDDVQGMIRSFDRDAP